MLPVRLYKDDPYWIRPLDIHIEEVFDPKKNKLFKRKGSKCIRWILQDTNGQIIGRVAAFINPKTANKGGQPTGGMGFFECIDSQEAANLLFNSCREWLKENGMEAMDGPINFGEREAWWGLLVEGFDIEPNFRMGLHKPYYQQLFENYGFEVYFKQYTYGRPIMGAVDDKIHRKSGLIADDPDYKIVNINKKELDKFAQDFCDIYNKAWGGHKGVAGIKLAQAKNMMAQFKPIMDEKIILFAYYKEEPVAFFINLPELNQTFKHLNGSFNWLSKIKFMWYKYRKVCRKCFGVVFGVVPEHQRKGLDGAMISRFKHIIQVEYRQYDDFEMNWIGDFNPKMMVVAQQVSGTIIKTHHTYRYLFDRTKEFKRMPIIR